MQKEKKVVSIKYCFMLAVGLLFCVTVCMAYLPYFTKNGVHELELTFLSNLITGLLFLSGGMYGFILKKDLPQWLYTDSVILLQIVFFICMAFMNEFHFGGAWFFLHIVNPVLATLVLFFCMPCKRMPNTKIFLSALVFPTVYFAYVMIYGCLSGHWIYGIFNISDKGSAFVMILTLICVIGISVLAWVNYKITNIIKRN